MAETTTRSPARRRSRNLATGLSISMITIMLMLCLGEVYFRYFNLQSDAYYFTLMEQRWRQVCWKPTFSLKSDQYPDGEMIYRDRPWSDADVQGKKKIMLVGDSMVAGLGVCNAHDRFGDILQSKLGERYAVFNVAYPGWNTPDEIRYPALYPYKPDIVVLSYYLNDIETAMTQKHPTTRILASVPWWSSVPVLKDSYLLDYVYWQVIYKQIIYRQQFTSSGEDGWNAILNSFSIPDVWAQHQDEIIQLINWAKQDHRPVIAIVWPGLQDMESCVRQTALVEAVFRAQNIPVISVLDMFRNDPVRSLVVSAIDAHPNENVHRRVAETLYQAVLQMQR